MVSLLCVSRGGRGVAKKDKLRRKVGWCGYDKDWCVKSFIPFKPGASKCIE
jgi:hypothetical protein